MNQAKRSADREKPFKTAQVARILGINLRTLQHRLASGRYPEPPRDPDTGYRIWHHHDMEAVRSAMQEESSNVEQESLE